VCVSQWLKLMCVCTYIVLQSQTVCTRSFHLHNKAFVVAASTFRDEFIFEASSLLVELHDGVLPTCCQYGTLSSHLESEKR